jgi:hypothetical protein
MIKNLLWKQAMKLAKKKFGDLNTNEANKWLVDKYNALLGKENTKNIANKIREDLKRDRPFDDWKPEVVPKKSKYVMEVDKRGPGYAGMEHPIKPQKWNPFKKEGKKIDFMDYYTKRKRGEFDDGGIILPQPKPYNFEEKIEFLKKIKGGVGPKTYLQLMSNTLNEGVENKAITKEERDNFLKRFTGTISEDWTSAIDDENLYMYEGDYERYPPKKFNEGGFTGSNVYFQDKFDEYDFATRYNMMSPKEGFDQLIQDYKNAIKMEEGESGKLPPIPLSLLKSGLGYILKQLAGGKFDQGKRDFLEKIVKPKEKIDSPKEFKFDYDELDRLKQKWLDKINLDKNRTLHQDGGLAGMLGETQQVGYATDRNQIVKELYDKAGGFEGTGKTFEEFMADVLFEGDYLAKGGRVGLKGGGMTPSEKWMRDYYFDGKGGYDQWMSFQEFQMGPGVDLWYKHIGKYAEGGRAGYLKGGLLRTGIMEALDFFTRKGSRQGVDVRETILPADDVGDYAINMGDVRELFTNLDKTFAGKITSKESVDDIITRFRDKRKLDLSESIKEFLNNRIKQYKSGLENIKKYGQSGSIEEVGDHAEELRYLIKETRKDIDAIDKYGLTQQSKKATKHAEGGVVGLKDGGTLLEKYKEYAPKGPWIRGLWDTEATYELYRLLEPYMSLFMKEGGRVGFKEGKGMSRRAFLKLMGAAAALPVVGKYFKLAKPAAKVMDDIKITLRGDGDWSLEDDMWTGGNWVNYSFEALTDKGRKILAKLSKGKNASLVDDGKGMYTPIGRTSSQELIDEAEHAVDAVDSIKKAKGNISLNTQVGSKVKGAKPEKYKDMDLGYSTKTYGSKEINKKTILDEADDYWVGDYGGYKNKGFYDENVEEIIDIITKKAEGGRVGLYKGGIIDLLIAGGKFLNKNSPVELYKKYLKSVKERTLKANETGKFTDLPLEVIPIGAGGALVTNYLKKKLKSLDEQTEEKAEGGRITDYSFDDYMREREMLEKMRKKDQLRREFEEDMRRKKIKEQKQWVAEGGRIGLDAGGPPISPANLHPLQRPMFYQGGLTKTIPPQRGPMPQGLQSNVYDGIMRPGVINGRN